MFGRLIPLAGGDAIPLVKSRIVIGRRPNTDITLDFRNVSGKHCELVFDQGIWIVYDLKSGNGTRVNDEKITRKAMYPGDQLTIARKHHFRIEYDWDGTVPSQYSDENFTAIAPSSSSNEDIENPMGKSLLEKSGLVKPKPVQELTDSDIFEED